MYKTALNENSDHKAALFYLGLMDFDQGRMPLAKTWFERALGVGNDPILHVYMGETMAAGDDLAGAVAATAGLGRVTGAEPRARAGVAGPHLRDRQRLRDAVEHLLQREVEVVAEVGAALTAPGAATAPAPRR